MTIKIIYVRLIQFLLLLLFILLISTRSAVVYSLLSSVAIIVLICYLILTKNPLKVKILLIIALVIVMVAQQIFNNLYVFSGVQEGSLFVFKKLVGIIIMLLPLLLTYLNNLYKIRNQFSHSIKDMTVISFGMLKDFHNRSVYLKDKLAKGRLSLSPQNLKVVLKDIPRHSNLRYINKGNLTEEYFLECEKSLEDEHLYLVFSNTGSPASEIISLFTGQIYNHVSLSFDKDLKTIISYNGGENVFPPGLNQEQLQYFNKKSDASIIVYKLAVSRDKKHQVIENIKSINETGSAYNIIGLVTHFSIRPNIMFCSQFVYTILKNIDSAYFISDPAKVRPTDLIEKDYKRRLQFYYEIKFKEL